MRRRTAQTAPSSNALSYAIPVAIACIVLFLLGNWILSSWGSGSGTTADRSGNYAVVTPMLSGSEVYIYMSGDSRKKIDTEAKLFSTDSRLQVQSGEARIVPAGTAGQSILLDANAEIQYVGPKDSKERFVLGNGNAWVTSASESLALEMSGYVVYPGSGSTVAINQNTRASNLYVLAGRATVATLDGKITGSVGVGQQLTVVLNEIKNLTSFDGAVEPIDDFFRSSDWFLANRGGDLLSAGSGAAIGSGAATGTGGVTLSPGMSSSLVVFSYPKDEQTVDTETVDVTGIVTNDRVAKITLDDAEAALDKTTKNFTFKDFKLPSSVNNIVYKTFDADDNMLSKGVLTVYAAGGAKPADQDRPTVTTYPLTNKDFPIVSPAANPYKTTESVVRIDGSVRAGAVEYITVNGYRLTKFIAKSSKWYYFANKDFGTLNDGINLYTIRYFDANDKVVGENLFTIVKEPAASTGATNAATSATGATTSSLPNPDAPIGQ